MGKSIALLPGDDGVTHHHKLSTDQQQMVEVEDNTTIEKIQTSSEEVGGGVAISSKQHSDVEPVVKPTAKLSPPSSRILAPPTSEEHPFFYYQNSTHSQPHYFSLHSHPNHLDASLYSNYGTTLTIIILLHLVYFYQWNTRRSRQELCTSYDQLVEKKQFYRVAVAIASHPPVDGGERDTMGNILSHHGMMDGGEASDNARPAERVGSSRFRLLVGTSSILHRGRPLYNLIQQRILHPLIYGSLSGLPLLAFATHILWQCRALEELYDDYDGKLILGVIGDVNVTQFSGIGTAATKIQTAGDIHSMNEQMSLLTNDGYSYFRVIVALGFTSIILELSLLRSILRRIDQVVDFDGYRTTPRQLLSQRAICSIASLSTALLGVYDSHFPYAPPPVLPFVRVSFLSSSGFSLIFSIMVLTILSHRIHPVTSIMSGLLSGSLWSMGLTSFLGTVYWGNVMLFSLALAMLFSLKAQPTYSIYLEKYFPCIDYVTWDGDGCVSGSQSVFRANASRGGITSQINSNGDDLETGSQSHQSRNRDHYGEERFPLLSSQSSSMSGGSSNIRGRVPLINTMESDLEGAGDVVRNNEDSMPAASSRFGASLSRRVGGSGVQ